MQRLELNGLKVLVVSTMVLLSACSSLPKPDDALLPQSLSQSTPSNPPELEPVASVQPAKLTIDLIWPKGLNEEQPAKVKASLYQVDASPDAATFEQAKAELLADVQSPIALNQPSLTLLFNPNKLLSDKQYWLSVTVTQQGKAQFTAEQAIKLSDVPEQYASIALNALLLASPYNLTNTYWRLVSLSNMDAQQMGLQTPFMQLDSSQAQVRGFAGCNSFFGRFEQQGSQLLFSQLGSTRQYCMPTMAQEDAFMQMLNQASQYLIEGPLLKLMDKQKKVLATFTAKVTS